MAITTKPLRQPKPSIATKPMLQPKPVTPVSGPLDQPSTTAGPAPATAASKPRITAAQAMANTLSQVQANAAANGQTWLGVGPGDQAWDAQMAKAIAANPALGRPAAGAEPAYLGAPTDSSPKPPNNLMAIADALYTPNGQAAAAAAKPTVWVDPFAGTRSEGWEPAYTPEQWKQYLASQGILQGAVPAEPVSPVQVIAPATATVGGAPPPPPGGISSGPLDQNYTTNPGTYSASGLQAQELAAAAAYQRALAAQETAVAQNQLTTLGLNRTAVEGQSERDLWDQQRQLGAQFGQLGTVRSGAYQRQAARSVEDNMRDRTAVLQQYQQEMARLQLEVQQGIKDRSEAAIAQQQAQIRTAWAMSQLGDIG